MNAITRNLFGSYSNRQTDESDDSLSLPLEVWNQILDYLDLKSIKNMERCSKKLFHLSRRKSLQKIYPRFLVDAIGLDKFYSLPKVEVGDIKKDYMQIVKITKKSFIVRGQDASCCPFIACRYKFNDKYEGTFIYYKKSEKLWMTYDTRGSNTKVTEDHFMAPCVEKFFIPSASELTAEFAAAFFQGKECKVALTDRITNKVSLSPSDDHLRLCKPEMRSLLSYFFPLTFFVH